MSAATNDAAAASATTVSDATEDSYEDNKCKTVNTDGMRVISYYESPVNQINPYNRIVGIYGRERTRNQIKELVTEGTMKADGGMIEDDSTINVTPMKNHQKRLVFEMKQYENNPYNYTNNCRVGFLCDDVGTGKSLSILSLIGNNPKPSGGESKKVPYVNPILNQSGNPFLPTVMDFWSSRAEFKEINSSLIVVPHNIFFQWKLYLKRDIKLSYVLISTKKQLETFINKVDDWVENPDTCPNIVLCKSTLYNTMMDKIEEHKREYINYCESTSTEFEEGSIEESIAAIPEIASKLRDIMRNTNIMLKKYRRGNSDIKELTEHLKEIYTDLDSNKNHMNNILEYQDEMLGNQVERVIIPKSGLVWNRVIFDEADTIPISSSRSVLARMYWLMSANYQSFIYPLTAPPPHRTGFIRNMMLDQVKCSFYIQHCLFRNTQQTIRDSFPLPDVQFRTVECLTPNHIRVAYMSNLRNVIDAVNAGDTDLALQLCNCETEDNKEGLIESLKNKMKANLEDVQKRKERLERHIRNISANIEEVEEVLRNMGAREDLTSPDDIIRYNTLLQANHQYNNTKRAYLDRKVRVIQEEQSILNRLDSMQRRLEETITQDCPICMESIADGKRAVVQCCNQSFCVDCLLQQIATYQHRTTQCPCPMCRAPLTPQSFTVLKDASKQNVLEQRDTEGNVMKSKEQNLKDLLKRDDLKRVLMFSGHDSTFKKLQPVMETIGVKYELLNGQNSVIQKKIQRWIDGKVKVLCLNTHVLGAGLNLPQATDIIIYHQQNTDMEHQIVGRAQRPGRDPSAALRVWRLAYETEYRDSQQQSSRIMSAAGITNDSGFTSFEEARQALILRYYHKQPDFTQTIHPSNVTVSSVYDSRTLAEKASVYPIMNTKMDFAREYILLLAQWNQKDLFEKKKIRDFVNYIEARRGSFMVPVLDAQVYDSNVTLLTQLENTTVQPWTRGNEPFIRELADSYFST